MENEQKAPQKKENGLLNILVNVVIPTVILMKLSNEQYLGPFWGFIVAFMFPLSYGTYDLIKTRKVNFFSALGLINVLLTGGIGLLQLSREWMIAKETGIPFLMGTAVIVSQRTKWPLVRTFLDQMLDLQRIDDTFKENGHDNEFEEKMSKTSYMLGSTFFISSILNFGLARYILEGDPGTEVFNKSLGQMNLMSFPVIVLPMIIMVFFIMFYLSQSIKKMTNQSIEDFIKTP